MKSKTDWKRTNNGNKNNESTYTRTYEPPRDKTNKMACAPSEDSDQPGHPPSLIGVFTVRMKKAWVLSYPLSAQRRLWSDWADAQADLSLRWAHILVCWFYHEAAHMFFVTTAVQRTLRPFIKVSCNIIIIIKKKKKKKKNNEKINREYFIIVINLIVCLRYGA